MEAPATSIHSFVDYSASGGAFSFANNPFQQQMASCVHQRESVLIFPHSNGIVPDNGFPIAPGAQPMSELPDTKVFGSTITTSTSHSIQTELPKAKRMDEDCWTTEFGVHADNGLLGAAAANSHHQTSSASSLLIRDDFIFSDTAQCSSPPSNTLAGNTEFIYEPVVPAANSILEDAFLSVPNPLLEAPCTSFASSAFVDPASAYRFRDGSVGISPCSSSTQISTGTTDDSIFLPQTIHQQQQQHSSLQHQFLDGIFRSIPLNVYPASTNQSHHQFQVQDNGLLLAAGRESGVMDGEGNDDDEEEEQRDVKPVFLLDQQQQQRNDGLAVVVAYNGDGEEQHLFGGDDEEYSALSPPPPPPPLTPPSKTRSKMHDLALKHRLITNQNMRGHGQIQLSTEEKKTLIQEGFPIPSKLPLMREEEEALKIVRRKIKNKLSAQESRRKRKEYMDMLEKRAHAYFADNTALRQKIRQLETTNRYLLIQLQHKPATGDIAAESVQ